MHAIGFDDAPFPREHRGDVRIFGAAYAGATLHAVVSGKVRRDGANSTAELARLCAEQEHLQLIFLQGRAQSQLGRHNEAIESYRQMTIF